MRQIILDTETTGLEPSEGHRIIEIGCVELVGRRLTGNNFHQYVNPDRDIDSGAVEVHGITTESLKDKPRFADIVSDFLDYVRGAELIIHNAPFDVGFLNHEFGLIAAADGNAARIEDHCGVVDTLKLARSMHPGQKNDLDSLCRRYGVDNTQRTLHGALLDAEILADVYLAMTGGQATLFEEVRSPLQGGTQAAEIRRFAPKRTRLPVIAPSAEELAAHERWLDDLEKQSNGQCLWKRLSN
jgi:DNA polymerase-3 subunit epsilon